MATPDSELNAEQKEQKQRFIAQQKAFDAKAKELEKVCTKLFYDGAVKQHKSIFMQRSSCEFFRGVNFHPVVLQNGAEIMKMLPTLQKDGELTELKTL